MNPNPPQEALTDSERSTAVETTEQQRHTLSPRDRNRTALAAMDALDPVFSPLSDETRIAILVDLKAEYVARAASNGSKPGPKKAKP